MPAPDLALLIDAARAAGEIAHRHWRADPKVWSKEDGSPVSEADIAVDRALSDALRTARPSYGWLSEEQDDDEARLGAAHCFIVDPIDGTRAYLDGQETWALSLAVTTADRVTAAVIHMPAHGRTYAAAAGQGALLNGTPIRAGGHPTPQGARLLASKPTYAARHWQGEVPDFRRAFRPSIAYRLAMVAEGRADAMLTLRQAWEWDIAAGALIAQEAGCAVTDRTGRPLRFNTPGRTSDGVACANPGLHQGLVRALA